MNEQLFLRYLNMAGESAVEIDEIVDGRVDIDENGNANYAMKIQLEANKIRLAVSKLREMFNKEKDLDK